MQHATSPGAKFNIGRDIPKIFWKIDYYDPDFHKGSIDPANPQETCHDLTIMLSEEY